ncbi:uncharacterized protein LOC122722509 [Manihot esculenta]|uniref:uncharacterized protein LOC122722509 n=1 Tax=Manihot esculenta TaxID=3983 RepID=UPI001CC47262|nr:uncharacterized protein LOC122722509 [Manihot esculenta]
MIASINLQAIAFADRCLWRLFSGLSSDGNLMRMEDRKQQETFLRCTRKNDRALHSLTAGTRRTAGLPPADRPAPTPEKLAREAHAPPYVTGNKKQPDERDPDFPQWDSNNCLVMTWLLNSMQPNISKSYLLIDTAAKIWKALSLTYSKIGNDAQIYDIRNKIHGTKQGEMTISQFYSELCGLWQELDYYQDFQADCTGDTVKFQRMIEKERVYDFLAGLNNEYDPIRVQVLGRNPFPSLQEAHAHVQQEESRRHAMLYTAPVEKAGLTTSLSTPQPPTSEKDQLHCDYCGKPRHTKETCWKLHGRPTRGRGGKRGTSRNQANLAETVEEPLRRQQRLSFFPLMNFRVSSASCLILTPLHPLVPHLTL